LIFLSNSSEHIIEIISIAGMIKTAGITLMPVIAIAIIFAVRAVISIGRKTSVTVDMRYPNGFFFIRRNPEIKEIGRKRAISSP
jgi:hypothetical protein